MAQEAVLESDEDPRVGSARSSVARSGRLRVGFIAPSDPTNPEFLSGMPFGAWQALSARGLELVALNPERKSGALGTILSSRTVAWIRSKARQRTSLHLREKLRSIPRRLVDTLFKPFEYRRSLGIAKRVSEQIGRTAAEHELDVLFGICISSLLYKLDSELPIVYCSDATARLINETYPKYRKRGRAYHRACDEMERRSLSRVWAGIFSSPRTLESAVEDYGFPPDRAHLLHKGATVLPEDGEEIEPEPPSRSHLELVVVARDPVRKRVDFCIDVAQELASRGWNVRLNLIGPPTRRALRSPLVHCLGTLRLSSAEDRDIHRRILRGSHLMLQPSSGEMYGIAPCESAHFGRPSLVSDIGGLSAVVEHGRTGFVLPLSASAAAYANRIEALASDPDRYLEMSRAALQRARKLLTWDAWAEAVIPILEEASLSRKTRVG